MRALTKESYVTNNKKSYIWNSVMQELV